MTREIIEQIDALLDGEDSSLTKDAFDKLQNVLRSDPAALAYYCQQAEIHGRLEWELGDPKNQDTPVHAPAIHSPTTPKPPHLVSPQVLWSGIAAALALVLGIVLYQGITHAPEQPEIAALPDTAEPSAPSTDKNAPVARLTSSRNAQWGQTPHTNGSWLKPGMLHLRSGSAEISFDSGARIILQGPAKLKLITAHHASLTLGKATTHIPSQAAGFKLDTPSSRFSDQNSSFSVAVDHDGSAEVHVIRGLVEATPKTNPKLARVLSHRESLRLTDSTILANNKIKHTPKSFDQELPSSPGLSPSQYLHWSLDGQHEGRLAETGNHTGAHFPASILARPGTSKYASADFIRGRFGKAIQLNGRGAFLSSDFPGIAGSGARTVSFWVRIAPGTPNNQAYSMVAWGTPGSQTGEKWQIAWNKGGDNKGKKGAIRTEFGGGFVVGSTNLRDGRWHHITVVFLGGESANVATHIRHYVDGRLETVTASKRQRINTRLTSNTARPTYIGRRLEDDSSESSFKGALDEIYIFPAALTPKQIDLLYRRNITPQKVLSAKP